MSQRHKKKTGAELFNSSRLLRSNAQKCDNPIGNHILPKNVPKIIIQKTTCNDSSTNSSFDRPRTLRSNVNKNEKPVEIQSKPKILRKLKTQTPTFIDSSTKGPLDAPRMLRSHALRNKSIKNDILKVMNIESTSAISSNISTPIQNHVSKQNTKIIANKTDVQLVRIKAMPTEGDMCFGHIRGHPPWPCFVEKIEKTTIWVKFLNSELRLAKIC